MRIAIDLTALADNFSGIERFAANIALGMITSDSNNSYILVFKDEVHTMFEDASAKDNVDVFVVSSNGKSKLVFTQLMLPKALKKLNADIYLFMAFPAPLLFGRPSLSTIHDLSCWDCPETMTSKSRLLWRVLDGKAAKSKLGVLTISEFSKSRIVEHYGINPNEVHVIYCGIDNELFNPKNVSDASIVDVRAKYGLPKSFIMSLSTIEPRKNLPALIDAWVTLRQKGSIEQDLVLAGRKGWKMESLLADVPSELAKNICFTGFVDDEDLPSLYCACDLFVFPSIYEGFGLPPVEAACSGAKVLCSDIPCLKEICGRNVFYFELDSPENLASSIEREVKTGAPMEGFSKVYDWNAGAAALLENVFNGIEDTNNA